MDSEELQESTHSGVDPEPQDGDAQAVSIEVCLILSYTPPTEAL